jgi:hypothetical protein
MKTPKQPELKPCPFCGGAATLDHCKFGKYKWLVMCCSEGCPAWTDRCLAVNGATRAQAIRLWNTRRGEDGVKPLGARIAELEEALSHIESECQAMASDLALERGEKHAWKAVSQLALNTLNRIKPPSSASR